MITIDPFPDPLRYRLGPFHGCHFGSQISIGYSYMFNKVNAGKIYFTWS